MSSLLDYVLASRDKGPVALIGGHYAYPGRPDAFACASARHVVELAEQMGAGRQPVSAALFLDDIAASEACSAVGCSVQGPTRLASENMPAVAAWLRQHLPAIEALARAGDANEYRTLAVELSEVLRRELGKRVPRLAAAAAQPAGSTSLTEWLEAVESLTYVSDRHAFKPLLLAHELRCPLPEVLFERSMVNAASRALHKLKKSGASSGLELSEADGLRRYWVRSFQGDRQIELRHEQVDAAGGMHAANKCAAILSQLFFQSAKQARSAKAASAMSVLYVIPCYDRTRLHDGVAAFARLYGDVGRHFGVREVNVAVAFYCAPDREQLLCDEFRVASCDRIEHRTCRLSADADRAARSRPGSSPRSVYADNNATTAIDPLVLAKMMPFMTHAYGNPSSSHRLGWEAELAVDEARQSVADLIGADPEEIVFTSGATEANNWAIRAGTALSACVISSPLEHKSILEPIGLAAQRGVAAHWLGVNARGLLACDALDEIPAPPGTLVSLMAVNNEIHSVLDLERMGARCRERGFVFHTDAAQAMTSLPIDVRAMNISALSLSGHKIYGPKGIGALFLDRRLQERCGPHLVGGGQQGNLRAGTLPAALIVGFGEACRLAAERRADEVARLRALSERFLEQLRARGVGYSLVGPSLTERRAGALCLVIDGLDSTKLCEWIPEVALSQGSACNSRGVGSHVLRALGIDLAEAKSVVRIAFGRFNSEEDAAYVAERLAVARERMREAAASRLGAVSPPGGSVSLLAV